MAFIGFMASGAGRFARIIAGLALIGVGLLALHNPSGIVLAVIGAVPLAAGVFDLCLFAPLFRLPIPGSDIRDRATR